jgi:hypothetical protein
MSLRQSGRERGGGIENDGKEGTMSRMLKDEDRQETYPQGSPRRHCLILVGNRAFVPSTT